MVRGRNPKLKYQCVDCTRYFYGEVSPAETWLVDIETLPGWKRFWRLGEEDWNIDTIVYDWILLGWSAKRLFEPDVKSSILTPREAFKRDDRRLVGELYALFDQADILIAHNGDGFDIPKVQTRFIEEDKLPPSPFLTIDTKATARKAFGWTSNKLDYLARRLGVGGKMKTDYELWIGCEQGDPDSLAYMNRYNEGDIFTLEDVYIKLRPWIKHPNMGLYVLAKEGVPLCPHCGCDELDWSYFHRTPARVYNAARCNNCGAIGRDFKSFVSTTLARTRV